jgi:hypothetical protein
VILTDANYYRIVLKEVYNYPAETLQTMSDEDCESEYDLVINYPHYLKS